MKLKEMKERCMAEAIMDMTDGKDIEELGDCIPEDDPGKGNEKIS